ncbi:MAG: hypothetical protein AAGF20_04620 [Pseudomonadota bacterium]
MRYCERSLFGFALVVLAGCGWTSSTVEKSYDWNEQGEFKLTCAATLPGVNKTSINQKEGGLRDVAEGLCGGDYTLITYTTNASSGTGKPTRYDASIEFKCEPTPEVLARAEALNLDDACADAFKEN